MIDVLPHDLKIIKQILKKYVPDCEIRAFGSRVAGKAKVYSDLDLVIVGAKKIERKNMVVLKEAFEDSKLNFRVDIIDWQTISKSFRKIIESEYEIVVGKE
ncbi:MAG: nucleotidyltransferase domain-containing protein [Candidatus Omnitrophica bacterium]|nr:nucleotidyltransferase domain-containing protein [Candidatus Omnitrophota bacterium]